MFTCTWINDPFYQSKHIYNICVNQIIINKNYTAIFILHIQVFFSNSLDNRNSFSSITGMFTNFLHHDDVHVTGPLWGESTGRRWFPLSKASDAEL